MYDYLIIGGGIVGLSTAWQLLQREPGAAVLVLEKEKRLATHQTGRNSGVVHAGVYYIPGSLKATFCRAGVAATQSFCNDHDIPLQQCGKLIVATDSDEQERLLALFDRARENGLEVELLSDDELHEREPNVTGVGGIYVRDTAITDYPAICNAMAANIEAAGGSIRYRSKVTRIAESEKSVRVSLHNGCTFESRFVVACGGLDADRLAQMQGIDIDFEIVPYRGEYYQLPAAKNNIVKHLIYPVPNPGVPFLGIHLTRMIDGSVTIGPSALQGWKREGYGRFNFSLRDITRMLLFPGFWKTSIKNWRTGFHELRLAIDKKSYLRQVQKYCPSIELADLGPYRTGIRAMAVDRDGNMIDDFLFKESPRSLHVCNAPSPAATSAIPIGQHICERLAGIMNHK
ncbi:MAG: L-2-hydroxyglutarate oxidase [Gammaproteobacteria bacterium]|nr:L-2-hydroxyglutarate oxidase [Gammaproteobacteria bacterium]